MALPSRLTGLGILRKGTPKIHATNGNLIKVPVPFKGHVKSYELQDYQGRRVFPK